MNNMHSDKVLISSEELGGGKARWRRSSSVYTVDIWREVRRRWMVLGVLGAVTMAVLSPRLGAVGGMLHTEFSGCVPLFYVYYSAGRRASAHALWAGVRAQARLHALCVVHAHMVAPALCAAIVTAIRDGVDYRIVKGVMLWSRGGGCAWLSLALSAHCAAPSAAALVYLSALFVAPLATALICGRAALPSLLSVLCTLATTAVPFLAGLFRGGTEQGEASPGSAPFCAPHRALRLCALALLYAECCERLSDSEGILSVSDVLVTLMLEVAAVSAVAATSALYARCGVLSAADARLVTLCAVPRALDTQVAAVSAVAATSALYARCGVLSAADARIVTLCAVPRALDTRWEAAGGCLSVGLVRLPAVFLAPAQALLLAALVPDDAETTPKAQVYLAIPT